MFEAPKNVVICGAAGRDFHNFRTCFKDDPAVLVVAFTAAQIPGIAARTYPAELAGPRYPDGIPIYPQSDLSDLCRSRAVDEVVFSYSDVANDDVLALASIALAAGADFRLISPGRTKLSTHKPTIGVCAVRTGCGKSQTARHIARSLASRRAVAVLRHPMPYGDLTRQAVQRFTSFEALDAAACTIEEREEYEPHIRAGGQVFAGVDYQAIVAAAERECDVLLWDGGNNDAAFLDCGLNIVVVDALRPEQLTSHFPGHCVLLGADLIVVNKVNSASAEQLATMERNLAATVPGVPVVHAASKISFAQADVVPPGSRVLVVEDGPTITHGGVSHGAGLVAARTLRDVEIVDPREFADDAIQRVYAQYKHIGPVLPALGYNPEQVKALAATINASGVDYVVCGSPVDLAALITIDAPVLAVDYEYMDVSSPGLMSYVEGYLADCG